MNNIPLKLLNGIMGLGVLIVSCLPIGLGRTTDYVQKRQAELTRLHNIPPARFAGMNQAKIVATPAALDTLRKLQDSVDIRAQDSAVLVSKGIEPTRIMLDSIQTAYWKPRLPFY